MFGSLAMGIFVLLLVASIITRQTPLFVLSLAVFLAAGLARLWDRFCLAGLEYRRRLSTRSLAFGDTLRLEVEAVNRKLLPLPWLEIEDELPRELPPEQGIVYPSHKADRSLLAIVLTMRPYERVRRTYTIPCKARGEHLLGPVRLRTGDLFGTVYRDLVLERQESFVVYPRIVPLAELGLPAEQPLGDLRTQSWIFEDPSRIAGAREYRPGDSLRRIHWSASARTQRLFSKVFEPTTTHKLAIFVNVSTTEEFWWDLSYDVDVLELTAMAAASIAAWAVDRGYQVGLFSNGRFRAGNELVVIEPRGDEEQLGRMLEALGRLQAFAVRPFGRTLEESARRLSFGTSVVALTPVADEATSSALRNLRSRGHPVTLVLTGRREPMTNLQGVTVRHVGPPEEWGRAESLSLAGGAIG